MQNLRVLLDVLQAFLDQVLVLLQVRQVLVRAVDGVVGADNLGGQLNGTLQVCEVLELNVHGGDVGCGGLGNLVLRGSQHDIGLVSQQLFHVHVGALHGGVDLFNTGVNLLEPFEGLHSGGGSGQLVGAAQQQNNLVVSVPQVSDTLGVGRDGDLLAINILDDLGAVTVVLHEEAGVLLLGAARCRSRGGSGSGGGRRSGVSGTATGQGCQQQGGGQRKARVELRNLHGVSFFVVQRIVDE